MALTKILIGDTGTVAKSKIDTAFNLVDTHETKIGVAETDIDIVEADIIDVKADIVLIEAEQLVHGGKITDLESDVSTAESDIVTLFGSIGGVGDDITSLQTDISNIHDYQELPNDLKVTIQIESNKNKRFIKKTSTAQEITIDTTTSGGGDANGTIQIFLYDGSLTFVNTTAISVVGDVSYDSPAVIEAKLMENYLVIFDASSGGGIILPPIDDKTYAMYNQEWKEIHESSGGGIILPPIDDKTYAMYNQEWKEIHESTSAYEIVDNIYDDIAIPSLGSLAYNKIPVEPITIMSDQLDAERRDFAMVGCGDYLYSFGGEKLGNYLDVIKRVYIPDGSIKTVGATLSDGVAGLVGIRNGTDILLFEGKTKAGNYDKVLKFDTITQTISDIGAGNGFIFNQITKEGDNIYLMPDVFSDGIFKYSITENTFNIIAFSPNMSILDSSICAKGGKVYMFGGDITGSGQIHPDKIFEVDVVSGNVTELDEKLPNTSNNVKSILIGNDIYLAGNLGKEGKSIYIFNTISKKIRAIEPTLSESILSFFVTADIDDEKIYFRRDGINLQNIYEFDTKYRYEGVYTYKSFGWKYLG